VPDTATAFWGRGAQWNIPPNAVWSDAADSDACYGWARDTLGVLAADAMGVYSVEVRPGFPETEREAELAYGDNLGRLRALREKTDPASTRWPMFMAGSIAHRDRTCWTKRRRCSTAQPRSR